MQMRTDRDICPVCGERKLLIAKKGNFIKEWDIFCRYCCHGAKGKTFRKAYKNLWQEAINADELRGEL